MVTTSAAHRHGGDPAAPASRFGSGRSVLRAEDDALVRGRGEFTDNVRVPDEVCAAFLRSPHPHARIARIDAEAARRIPGVLQIVTGPGLAAAGVRPLAACTAFRRVTGEPAASPPRHALAVDTVHYVGEAVAAVIATDLNTARDALDAIVVDYRVLPAVVDAAEALRAEAPQVVAGMPDNVACEIRHGDPAAVEAAFRGAAHVVALDLVSPRVAPTPIEPRSTLAESDAASGRITLRVGCQTPTGLRDELCTVLPGLTHEAVRVVVGDIGGGFGMKAGLFPEDAVVAYAARALGRPVRYTATRIEEFLSATHGRALASHAELALDASGRALALRVRSLADVGAYATPAGTVIPMMLGPWVATSVYDIPLIDLDIKAVLTHTLPVAAYRGAGRPEAIYVIERLMDAASRATGIDPAALRRRNMIDPGQMPYTSAIGKIYDSGRFAHVMDLALERSGGRDFERRVESSRRRGRWRGRGIAALLEWTGGEVFRERVEVSIEAGGSICIWTAAQPMGQSLATTFRQLAVDVFGVAPERIALRFGDTDRARGFGSAGSRSLFVVGSAVRIASERTLERAREVAAGALEAAASDLVYRDGSFSIAGTDRSIGLFEVAAHLPGAVLTVQSTSAVDGPSWPNGFHVCEVEVDPETGVVSLAGYWSVNDVGRVINPMVVMGQLEGGATQGIGQALFERFVYDRGSGQAITATLMDYALPRAADVCAFEMTMDESSPCLTNPLGVKGVGELGTIGAAPAVVNAVIDALARNGCADPASGLQMPLTSETVWRAIHGETVQPREPN